MRPNRHRIPEKIERQAPKSRDRGLVVGVDIGGSNLRLALADLSGNIVGRWSRSTVDIREPRKIVQLICEGTDALLHEKSCSRRDLMAIAAGAPGITDTKSGVVLATSYLMGWRDVPLRDLLEAELGVPAFVDNDVNMAVFGEYSAGSARGVDDFVFLAIGTGVGAGIMLNGVGPGGVVTPMTVPILASPEGRAAMRQATPIAVPEHGQPEDIAEVLDFLVNLERSYLLGQIIFVDGGTDAYLRPSTP